MAIDKVTFNQYNHLYFTKLCNGVSISEVKRFIASLPKNDIGKAVRKGCEKAIKRYKYLAK